jgi:hypothetical protein
MGLGLNRKRIKKKKRSCPLCKPHKMGGDNIWKPKEYGRMKADVQEMRIADRRGRLILKP